MSNAVYDFYEGELPLLISVPHDGRELPDDIASRMTPAARQLPDTDWHVAELYAFARDMGASMICARYSRYVVDLNRPADDAALYPGQVATGICPAFTFAGDALYEDRAGVSAGEREARTERYWQPYHRCIERKLAELKSRHGFALLWDAHSIASEVPGLFDGQLPVLNLGTNKGQSCAADIEAALVQVAEDSDYTFVSNGRFTGGHITRYFGQPAAGIHAVQLELAQRSYMDEKTLRYDQQRATALRRVIRELLNTYIATAKKRCV